MGCEPSQNCALLQGPKIRISIVDSAFMKSEYAQTRQLFHASNITYEYFISLECFFEQFTKRYYDKVVTNAENYPQLKARLSKVGLMPNIYIVRTPSSNDKKQPELELTSSTIVLNSYEALTKHLKQNNTTTLSLASNHQNGLNSNFNAKKKKVDVKILCKPGHRTSEQTIFQAALSKHQISYEFYTSFQLLEQSLFQSTSRYIVTDYIFHKEVVQLINNSQTHTNTNINMSTEPSTPATTKTVTPKPQFLKSKTKIVCYCDFDPNETYSPQLDFLSNNYLDIANDIKNEIKESQRNQVKCTKIYLNSNNLGDVQEIKEVIQDFGIEVRVFQNYEKFIQETVYFFAVTVVAAESQIKNLTKFIQKNDYLERTKILSISPNTQPTPKCLAKLIRSIKKGYTIQKSITNSIDIIDKHYNNTKFEQIKKQLQTNDIKCFGYSNINEYIKEKKFISPFLICNFEQKMLVVKYIKQLHSKAKIIVFCSKNKITNELKDNANFCYVSSHFGKIIKFIQKTQVYLPVINRQQELQFKQKIENLRSKNKRISALKWSQVSPNQHEIENEQNFQFLNIARQTNQASIRDIQKSVATIWKTESSILQLPSFKEQFIKSLKQLHKIHKINFSDVQFNQLIQKIKQASFGELLDKVRTFFDADNQLGLEINKSLMKTQSLEKKQITHMREFLLLVFMNFFSGYQMARTGKKKIMRWVSNPLIQKCQIGSYLFCKHFVIFYEDSPPNSNISQLTKYKLQLQQQHNPLLESELLYNSFIRYKDKTIFCPFSQFQVESIVDHGQYTTIRIRYVKNVDFLKYIFEDNLLSRLRNSCNGEKSQASIGQFVEMVTRKSGDGKSGNEGGDQYNLLVNEEIRGRFITNVQRVRAIQLFKKGEITQAIQTHQKILKQIQEKQNLDSVLVNQLNYELACFNFKANQTRQAGRIIKQLLEAQPGDYIRQECQKMIKQVTDAANKQESQKNARRVSEQAMKTFEWLRDRDENEPDKAQDDGKIRKNRGMVQFIKDQESDSEDNGPGLFQHDVKCIDMGEIEDFDNMEIDKENVEQWQL